MPANEICKPLQYVQVSAEWRMRPNHAIAPPDTYIGMAGVSEVRHLPCPALPCLAQQQQQQQRLYVLACKLLAPQIICCIKSVVHLKSEVPLKSCLNSRALLVMTNQQSPHDMQVGGGHFFAEDTGELEGDMPGHDDDATSKQQSSPDALVTVAVTYTVSADGCIDTAWTIDASQALPAPLPSNLFK